MKTFKVLGSGCRNCEMTIRMIADQAEKAGVEAAIEKVTDMADILGYGVMSTPGVVLDGAVVHSGGVPTASQVAEWLAS